MVVGGRELIDTLWNVNTTEKNEVHNIIRELIDTLWNVNSSFLPYQWAIWVELIDTLWNVNFRRFKRRTILYARINRYIMECK